MKKPDLRRTLGLALILTGAVVVGRIGWLLWGTSFAEQRSQNDLRTEWEQKVEEAESIVPTTTAPSSTTTPQSPPTTLPGDDGLPVSPLPAPAYGEPIGEVDIPAIGIKRMLVEGSDYKQLRRGPGHVIGTPLPGQAGNSVISGHRTTYGQPFHNLDKLKPGDLITVTTIQGRFTYKVESLDVVKERDTWVMDPTDDNRMTVITCHPKYSRKERLIAHTILTSAPVPKMENQDEIAKADAPDIPEDRLEAGEDLDIEDTVYTSALVGLGATAFLVVIVAIWSKRRMDDEDQV